ncbi:MAG: YcjF family protein [Candidatus Competibacterales bacterium]
MEQRRQRAQEIVNNYVMASAGTALIPLPIVDLVGLTALQLRMLERLTQLYGLPFNEQLGKATLSALISAALPVMAKPLVVGSLAKSLPGLGSVVGSATTVALGGTFTYASGQVFIQHFESGKTLGRFSSVDHCRFFRQTLRTKQRGSC